MKERPFITIYRTWVPVNSPKKEAERFGIDNLPAGSFKGDTRKAGWFKDGGINYVETYEFSKKVAKRHITKGTVVIDLLSFEVIKNNTGIDNKDTVKFFIKRYDEEIARFVDQFLIKDES